MCVYCVSKFSMSLQVPAIALVADSGHLCVLWVMPLFGCEMCR